MSERPDPHRAGPARDPHAPLGPANPPGERPDPHLRPPDPAGTRPKVHPDKLMPRERPRVGEDLRALPTGEPAERALPGPASAAPPPATVAPRAPAAQLPPHAPRFQFLLGAFGALGAAAAGVALVLAFGPSAKPGPAWSAWKPSGDVDPATQIAAHVEGQYALSRGHRLVEVKGGPQAVAGQPVVVALRTSGSSPAALPENGVFYQLCGDGGNCAIPGKPSAGRGLLVRREALELALYTFHYVSSASQVVVTFPPLPEKAGKPAKGGSSHGSSSHGGSSQSSSTSEASASLASTSASSNVPSRVLLFRPQDLAPELARPLEATLSAIAPTTATVYASAESHLVDQLTGPLVYDSTLIPQQQQSSAVLLLQQASIGG